MFLRMVVEYGPWRDKARRQRYTCPQKVLRINSLRINGRAVV